MVSLGGTLGMSYSPDILNGDVVAAGALPTVNAPALTNSRRETAPES